MNSIKMQVEVVNAPATLPRELTPRWHEHDSIRGDVKQPLWPSDGRTTPIIDVQAPVRIGKTMLPGRTDTTSSHEQ